MNVTIIDPLQGDFPEVIEEYLQHGNMKCIAFNRRGTLLAAGCSDGSCVIWDFETRGIVKELRDKDCIAPITSVCWSKYGHHLLASATDRSLTLWEVERGQKIARVALQQTTLLVRLHPGSCKPSICLACPLSSAPILVDLNTNTSIVLPVSVSDSSNGSLPHPRNKFADGSPPYTPTAATFNKNGDLIYVGNSKGEILIVDFETKLVLAMIPISGSSIIRNIVFSRNGQYLLTNSNDRVIRVFENLLPVKKAGTTLVEMSSSLESLHGAEKLKTMGLKCLILQREFQDAVTKIQWKAPCFSGDGEWVVGASASKGEHKIYVWDRSGYLAKILEGPKEALIDLAWHPVRPIVVSVSIAGLIYIWAKDYAENWSAFAPDFKELEENEEYVEREDEFDLVPEIDKVREREANEDEEVDIVNFEDSAFSDSDASLEELVFLTAVPSPDVIEQHDKYVGSTTKVESMHSASPISVDAEQNEEGGLPSLSPAEGGNSAAEETGGANNGSKRRRRPSAKGLELQADQVRKPLKKSKSSVKSFNFKSKNGQHENGSLLDDDDDSDYDDDDDDVVDEGL